MNATSLQILNRGVPNQERLYFKALSNFDSRYIAVFLSTHATLTSINNGGNKAYWFPPKIIQLGDHVLLYSCVGTNSERIHLDGKKIHSFYWGLRSTIWSEPNSCAVLFDLVNYQATP